MSSQGSESNFEDLIHECPTCKSKFKNIRSLASHKNKAKQGEIKRCKPPVELSIPRAFRKAHREMRDYWMDQNKLAIEFAD